MSKVKLIAGKFNKNQLIGAAGVAGIIWGICGRLLYNKYQNDLRMRDFYTEALSKLGNSEKATSSLGTPFKFAPLPFTLDYEKYYEGNECKLTISVGGRYDEGYLFLKGLLIEEEKIKKCSLTYAELRLKRSKKEFIIYETAR